MIKISTLNLTQEGIEVVGELPPSILELEDELQESKDPVQYDLYASLVNNGVYVKGSIETVITCTCPRCLTVFKKEISDNDICHFYEKPLPSELDITEDIREDILIDLPQNLHCKKSCKGMCPKCGQNLNKGECTCSKNGPSGTIWDELDKLKH